MLEIFYFKLTYTQHLKHIQERQYNSAKDGQENPNLVFPDCWPQLQPNSLVRRIPARCSSRWGWIMSGLRLARSVLSKRPLVAMVARSMGGGPNMPPFARSRPPTSKVGTCWCDGGAAMRRLAWFMLSLSWPNNFSLFLSLLLHS